VVLRDQAYNAFGPFASGTSDPRLLLDGRNRLSLNRDLYFAIYQNLWSEESNGKRLFEQFPRDFFDLIDVDILGQVAFDRTPLTRYDRTLHLRQHERKWLDSYDHDAREVIYALLGKYESGGLRQIVDPRIFRVPPFRQMGDVRGVIRRFGGDPTRLRQTLDDLQRHIYAA
jgi:hypothetical protein